MTTPARALQTTILTIPGAELRRLYIASNQKTDKSPHATNKRNQSPHRLTLVLLSIQEVAVYVDILDGSIDLAVARLVGWVAWVIRAAVVVGCVRVVRGACAAGIVWRGWRATGWDVRCASGHAGRDVGQDLRVTDPGRELVEGRGGQDRAAGDVYVEAGDLVRGNDNTANL